MPAPTPVCAALTARPVAESDLDLLDRLHEEPGVMTHLGGVPSRAATEAFLRRSLEHWAQHGFGLWIFARREDGAPVGRGGLRVVELNGRTETDVSFVLFRDAWGKGYASDMVRAMVTLGFAELKLASIVGFAAPMNFASQRIYKKLGFAYETNILFQGQPEVLFRIAAPAA